MKAWLRCGLLGVVAAMAAGCPAPYRPGVVTELPTHGAHDARVRFEAARARFEQADYKDAAHELENVAREFPDDPIAPYARLYEALAELRLGDLERAATRLRAVADDTTAPADVRGRGRFYLGVADAELGRAAEARAMLEPFRGKITEGDDAGELHAALAETEVQLGELPAALADYDAFWAFARPAEKAYIVARVSGLVDKLDENAADAIYRGPTFDHKGPTAAFLGRRLAANARAAGNVDLARELLSDTAVARSEVGLEESAAAAQAGNLDPQLVGAVLPLSGKRHLVGEAAGRGLALAAGTYERVAGSGSADTGLPHAFVASIEDAGEGKGRAGVAVDALAASGAIAAIGPLDHDAVEEAALHAETAGLPLVTLDMSDVPLSAGAHVFRIVVSVEARARALAAWGRGAGAKRFAILQPDLPYAARAAAAFTKEVEAEGGTVVATVTYSKDAVSFVDPVGKLARNDFDALFIPDTAARLELVAPQLAVADLVVLPPGTRRPKHERGRAIVLLSTAEALSPKFLHGSGRYAAGAALAPGFYPDDADKAIGAYVSRYKAVYGDDPTYLDAYAWDAALVLRAVIERGAVDREAVAQALSALGPHAAVHGLTGELYFDPGTRERGDRGVIYQVSADGDSIHALRK